MALPRVTTVIGAGSMGPGIAALLARYGSEVRLHDISREALFRAEEVCDGANDALDQLDVPLKADGSVSFHSDQRAALQDATFVIEAVPEQIELKRALLAQIDATVAPDTIIATNTSGIPISDIATSMSHPERFIGMHWSNPAHLIPMIEVIPGAETSSTVVDQLVAIVTSFGYEAIVEKEIPGFVENRVLYAVLRECMAMLEEGIATAEDIDTCVKWGVGYKLSVIGPLRLVDMAGLDIYQAVGSYLNAQLSNTAEVSSLVSELTARDKLGMKGGAGLYSYEPGEVAQKRADIIQGLIETRKTLASIRRI